MGVQKETESGMQETGDGRFHHEDTKGAKRGRETGGDRR
jgi:hypothetical protein